ncbi:MAG TPA: LCP family protein [Actinomycetota bacterium]|nr:LCP family protein [Actinomycetota bacterium]
MIRRLSPAARLGALALATLLASLAMWSVVSLSTAEGQEKAVRIRRTHNGYFRPEPNRPIFVLAIGSDAGSPRYKRDGPVDRGRADSIHVIAINPQTKRGTIVGIPRDAYVNVRGYAGRINGALTAGGMDRMVDVVEQFTGLTMDYSMLVSFEGFEFMINELGGVVVDVPYDIRDPKSRAKFDAGQQVLGGFQALAFARNRYSTPRGDFSRSENQGLIMLGALRRARAETFEDPGKFLHYLRILYKYVDTDLPVDEALQLGLMVTRIQTTDIENVVVDGYPTMTSDGASVVQLTKNARRLFDDIAPDAVIDDRSVLDPGPRPSMPRAVPEETDEPLPEPDESTEPSPDPSESAEATPDPQPSETASPTPRASL